MRKWVVLMDIVLLVTALAILLIDYKIKEDIVSQAKALQGVINGQGTKAADSSPDSVPGGVLRGNDPGNAAVADQDSAEKSTAGNGRTKRNNTPKRSTGDPGQGIPGQSEQLGS
jgi:hypothetical protein